MKQINAGNVGRLGLAWSYDTQSLRGLEATPLVANGVLYASADWSNVFAVDARSGRQLWRWDSKAKVIIGNGGAEFGVRGFASAYDTESGTDARH